MIIDTYEQWRQANWEADLYGQQPIVWEPDDAAPPMIIDTYEQWRQANWEADLYGQQPIVWEPDEETR